MKFNLLFFIPIICFPSSIYSFKNIGSTKLPIQTSLLTISKQNEPTPSPIVTKTKQFLKLIRINNIIPTLFLCGTGGWLINPSFNQLIQSKTFIASTIDTILIMSASMAINDVYDLETDKINNSERPLVTGAITKNEAIAATITLISISEYLNFRFLPSNLQPIIHLSVLFIYLYTPIFKKIFVIKNISCALLVSFSFFFSGLAAAQSPLGLNKNFDLLIIGCNLIFTGSWSNEIILDIRDYEGDKKQQLQTIPTILGKEIAWTCAGLVLYIGVAVNTMTLVNLFNFKIAICFIGFIIPQIYNLFEIRKKEYSNESIEKYMTHTNKTLFLLLICLANLKV